VASVAVVAGALYSEPGECRPSRAVPLLDIHGTEDAVVPYAGRTPTVEWPLPMQPVPNWLADWAARDGAEVVHYRINGGDHQAPRSIDGKPFAEVVWEFFAAHPLGG
jgi:polyhydroxybutyrate depolymerase